MKGYGQYCPISKAAEVVAERWTPLVLREIILHGSRSFNEIHRGVPLMSRTLLSKRLKELERHDVISRRTRDGRVEYTATEGGVELLPTLMALGEWAVRRLPSVLEADDLDPRTLIWHMRHRIDTGRLPDHRVAIEFRFTDVPAKLNRAWLVLHGADVDACLKDPGFPIDLVVTTSMRELTTVWLGRRGFSDAQRHGDIRVEGKRSLVRAFPTWLQLSIFVDVTARSAGS